MAIEIKGRGAGWNVDDSACRIEGHSSPVVRRARCFPGVRWPGVIPEFSRMRNGVEAPSKLSRAHIVGMDISGGGRKSLRHFSAHDNEVFINDSRRVQRNVVVSVVAAKILSQIDPAILTKRRNRLSRLRIERV